MLIKHSSKPIVIIGFEDSSLTQEYYEAVTYSKEKDVRIITPLDFLDIPDKNKFQYMVGFLLELDLRKEIIKLINTYNLDCVSYIHENCFLSSYASIGKGVFIAPFSSVCRHAKVGNHSCIETYCLISHYTILGENTIVRSGTKIAGKTSIGENCTLGFNSGVSNGLSICNDVHLGGFSNITKNIEIPGVYAGFCARLIKKDINDNNAI